jgi:hypothetical protein
LTHFANVPAQAISTSSGWQPMAKTFILHYLLIFIIMIAFVQVILQIFRNTTGTQ